MSIESATAPQYHYAIVRLDVPSWPAQLGHAAAESAVVGEHEGKRLQVGLCAFVALAAKNADELAKVEAQLVERGIKFWKVIETDGDFAGQMTAIGVYPGDKLPVLRWLPMVKVPPR